MPLNLVCEGFENFETLRTAMGLSTILATGAAGLATGLSFLPDGTLNIFSRNAVLTSVNTITVLHSVIDVNVFINSMYIIYNERFHRPGIEVTEVFRRRRDVLGSALNLTFIAFSCNLYFFVVVGHRELMIS